MVELKSDGVMEDHSKNPIFPHSNISLSRGFTLIEILLVTVIILIAAAVSVPLFRGTLQSTQMRDAARTTIRMARYARSMAILKQTESVLLFADKQIVISTEPTNGVDGLIIRKMPQDIFIAEFESSARDGITTVDKHHAVHYYPTGMNDGFTLPLSDGGTRRTEISCDPITGKVKVKE